ncbi:MAG: peptidoglycan DD-metalloendopeptidase family protein [Novosphingobium sp.]
MQTPIAAGSGKDQLIDVSEVHAVMTAEPGLVVDAGTPVAVITFGRAVDVDGRTMYGHRSEFADTSSVVVFSMSRPRAFAAASEGRSSLAAPHSSGPAGPLPRYLPVSARLMTSGFGSRLHPILGVLRNHLGVDLAVPAGTPIAATADGIVSFAGWDGGYGLLVAVDHGNGIQTRYAHMSRVAVVSGQRVLTGAILGSVGTTGLSTGPHVHYEVRVNGQAVSPFGR